MDKLEEALGVHSPSSVFRDVKEGLAKVTGDTVAEDWDPNN